MNDVDAVINAVFDAVATTVVRAVGDAARHAALEQAAKLVESSACHFSLDEDPGSVRYDWSVYLAGEIRRLGQDGARPSGDAA